jgi:uncharacterized membrane protein YkvI
MYKLKPRLNKGRILTFSTLIVVLAVISAFKGFVSLYKVVYPELADSQRISLIFRPLLEE